MFSMITSWTVRLGAKKRTYTHSLVSWLFVADSTKTPYSETDKGMSHGKK